MIAASAILYIKARHPRQEPVPKWKTRGPNDRSETPSRQCSNDSGKRFCSQAFIAGIFRACPEPALGLTSPPDVYRLAHHHSVPVLSHTAGAMAPALYPVRSPRRMWQMSTPRSAQCSTRPAAMAEVWSVLSSSTWIRSDGQSRVDAASINRAITSASLKTGSCTRTVGCS